MFVMPPLTSTPLQPMKPIEACRDRDHDGDPGVGRLELEGHVERRREHGHVVQFGAGDQRPGYGGRGGADVEQHGLAAGHLAGRIAADVGLLGRRGELRGLDRLLARHHAGGHRAAPDAPELTAGLECLEV
jgi:hypothetical protein